MDHRGVGSIEEPFLWYQRITELARSHGVEVIAVVYPADPGYLKSVSVEQATLIKTRLTSLGIHKILDFRKAFSDPSYFKDPDHLSRKGAIALLQRLEDTTGMKLIGAGVIESRMTNPN
jgi:poly-D-alanine transfer protein DltD